jgi:hypothetical protein
VVAYSNIVKPDTAAQKVVDLFDGLARQASPCHFRLVRDNDQKKAIAAQLLARLWNAGWDLHFMKS